MGRRVKSAVLVSCESPRKQWKYTAMKSAEVGLMVGFLGA